MTYNVSCGYSSWYQTVLTSRRQLAPSRTYLTASVMRVRAEVLFGALQAEVERVQATFMKELKEVNEKLKTSENAVAELRQMRCNLNYLTCFRVS